MFINKNYKFPVSLIFTAFLTLGLSISFQSLFAAWVAPTDNPPIGDHGTLIHGGIIGQSKDGGLILNHLNGNVNGLIVEFGNVGIGTVVPGARLDVNGNTNITGNLAITGTVDGKDIANNAAMLNEAETITGNWVNSANPWVDNEVSDTLTLGAASNVDKGALANTGTLGFTWSDAEISDNITIGVGSSISKSAISNSGTLSFDWANSEVSDTLTISSAGSVDAGAIKTGTINNNRLDIDLQDLASDGSLSAVRYQYGTYAITSAGTSGRFWKSDGVGRGYWGTASNQCYRRSFSYQPAITHTGYIMTHTCASGYQLILVTDLSGNWKTNHAAVGTSGYMVCCSL